MSSSGKNSLTTNTRREQILRHLFFDGVNPTSMSTRRHRNISFVRSSTTIQQCSSSNITYWQTRIAMIHTCYMKGGAVVQRLRPLGLRSVGRGFKSCSRQRCVTTLGKLFIPMCLCLTWYWSQGGDALRLGR